MEQFHTNEVSFSKDSLRGVIQWLNILQPPVLDGSYGTFKCRSFCPPETFILAVDYLYRTEDVEYQTNLLLDVDKRETICRVCLLDPTMFEATLDWATGQYSFLQKGHRGGWGSYLLLTRRPQIRDFLG